MVHCLKTGPSLVGLLSMNDTMAGMCIVDELVQISHGTLINASIVLNFSQSVSLVPFTAAPTHNFDVILILETLQCFYPKHHVPSSLLRVSQQVHSLLITPFTSNLPSSKSQLASNNKQCFPCSFADAISPTCLFFPCPTSRTCQQRRGDVGSSTLPNWCRGF